MRYETAMDRSTAAGLPRLTLPESLADGTVLLDAHRLEDAEAHLAGEDEEMRRRLDAIRPATLEETRLAMLRWIDGRKGGGPMFAYAVRLLPAGALVGGCELRLRSVTSASVSYWIFPRFRGCGYAARALSLLCGAAGSVGGLRCLEASTAADNHASRRVLEKAGFIESGCVDETGPAGSKNSMLLWTRPVAAAG
jgi:RimJ/RimL family protein N-acetyltransferase